MRGESGPEPASGPHVHRAGRETPTQLVGEHEQAVGSTMQESSSLDIAREQRERVLPSQGAHRLLRRDHPLEESQKSYHTILEQQIEQAEEELDRPVAALLLSGFAAGLVARPSSRSSSSGTCGRALGEPSAGATHSVRGGRWRRSTTGLRARCARAWTRPATGRAWRHAGPDMGACGLMRRALVMRSERTDRRPHAPLIVIDGTLSHSPGASIGRFRPTVASAL